jgi:hypothetical protein
MKKQAGNLCNKTVRNRDDCKKCVVLKGLVQVREGKVR